MDTGIFLVILLISFVILGASLVALFYALFTLSGNCQKIINSHKYVHGMFAAIKAELASLERRIGRKLVEISDRNNDILTMFSIATKMDVVKGRDDNGEPNREGEKNDKR